MTKSIFITATGTDIGKTYISGLIVKKLRDLGYDCGYYKPVLSGAIEEGGEIIPGDCAYVLKKANIVANVIDYVSYIFKPAVSPHLAAEIENNPVHLQKIIEDFNRIKCEHDYLVVEGAGGIVCPFNLGKEKIMLPDVIKALGLDIIIVASAELGTINSTVLTVEYAKAYGIEIQGIILNNYDETNFMHKDNLKRVEELTGINVIATVKKDDNELNIDKDKLLSTFKEICE